MGRSLLIGETVVRLRVKDNQLLGIPRDETAPVESAPCEDLDLVVIDSTTGLFLDNHVLRSLVATRTALVITDAHHLPAGVLLPLFGTINHGEVLHKQIKMSLPRKKRAWQQLVRSKISHQANLMTQHHLVKRRLKVLLGKVESGDTHNIEAQAAKIYWATLLNNRFRRTPQQREGLNGALDYGYAIMRALLARSVVATGLHPALAIHHSSRANHFALIDDLIEPLRPVVDEHVIQSIDPTCESLNTQSKQQILTVLSRSMRCNYQIGPLPEVLERYAENYKKYVFGETDELKIPEMIQHGSH